MNAIVKRAEDTAASESPCPAKCRNCVRTGARRRNGSPVRKWNGCEDLLSRRNNSSSTLSERIEFEAEDAARERKPCAAFLNRGIGKNLAAETEYLRSESEKSRSETARREMNALREQLSRQQQAVATADSRSRYDAVVTTLQQERTRCRNKCRAPLLGTETPSTGPARGTKRSEPRAGG